MKESELLLVVKTIDMSIRNDEEDAFDALLAWLSSEVAIRQFRSYLEGLLATAMTEQVDISNQLVGSQIDADSIVSEWLRQFDDHLKFVQNTTILAIRDAIESGLKDGLTFDEIVSNINAIYEQAKSARAALIARTETLSAMNHSAFEVYRLAGVPYKSWSTILDGRERDSHNVAHQQRVPIDQPFTVGTDSLMYPGDPSGSPSEIINCRCTVLPEFDMSRMIWTDAAMEHMVNAYLYRQSVYESHLREAVVLAFQAQQARVQSILRA